MARTLPTAHKLAWIAAAHAAGLRELEVGSFVPARLLPQLADTAELVAFARSLPGLTTSVLVPNLKGAQRAIECQADVMLLLSASHAHSLANLRQTPDAGRRTRWSPTSPASVIFATPQARLAPLKSASAPRLAARSRVSSSQTKCCACYRPRWTLAPSALA